MLQIVKGMEIQFLEKPFQIRSEFQIELSALEHMYEVISAEIGPLLDKGVICTAIHTEGEIISNIFTKKKEIY